ncbi:MAG: S1 RNA-binding domain-containing protein [Planctomycetes bacterium]|nr:S1 RNA-binding domain-containing protein [Planctomycetota bacterium]
MTSTHIVEHLAKEFSTSSESVRATLEMIDAGLVAPYIGRVRRGETGGLSETIVRRLARRREELVELDRRRGTILRMLESSGVTDAQTLDRVRTCVDRFELEDLFLPHRRPEPEVQLALDRGLGHLADQLVASVAGAPDEADHDEHEEHEGEAAASAPSPDAPGADGAGAATGDADAHAEAHDAGAEHAAAREVPETNVAAVADAMETVSTHADDGEESHSGSGVSVSTQGEGSDAALHGEIELTPALARVCAPFVQPDKGVHTEMEALSGAMRILSDRLGRSAKLRSLVRRMLRKHGVLSVRALIDESRLSRHKPLLRVRQPLRQIQGHRLLAIRQAQKERAVAAVISLDRAVVLPKVRAALGKRTSPDFANVLDTIALRALERRLLPTVDADVRLELKERADDEALRFLAQHLRQVLFSPTFPGRFVAGVDVNAKGDWTIALIDGDGNPAGEPLRVEVGEKDAATLGAEFKAAFDGKNVRAYAVGHGKLGRNAFPKLRAALAASEQPGVVTVVNESGLASYANSDLARHELAAFNVPQRMAFSLARRLQDPMAEILKVDPRHLGLGSEQGLVSKANVKRTLDETVESCVSHVGCDVNRAPASVLARVPGLTPELAKKIVEYRATKPIESREDLRNAGILSEAQWASSIAFLRVPQSAERLDATSLHPEQYALARRVLEATGASFEESFGRPGNTRGLKRGDFEVDEFTWRDLMRELAFPGRDPRSRNFEFRLLDPATDPVTLTKDRVVEGVITNVMSFGAFVDLGIEREGLVHISEISDRYVRDARELLSIGQVVRARIVEGHGPRVALSLKNVPHPDREARRGGGEFRGRGERGERGERGGRDDRGPRGGRGEGREREPMKPAAPVRAAVSRRDGLVPGSGRSSRDRGGRGGGGGFGGGGGGAGGGRGGRGGQRPGERDEGFRPEDLRAAKSGPVKFTPFADFFKAKDEGEGEPQR